MPKGFPDSFALTAALRASRRIASRGRGGGGRPGKAGLHYTLTNLILYKPVLQVELRSRSGMVGRFMSRVGNRVAQRARRQVGVKTGRLRASIRFSHVKLAGEAAVKIGAYTPYARMHHDGTRAHIITPNKPGGSLVFMKGSRIVRTPIVRHPGTKPNRYLTDQLRRPIARKILR